MDWINKFHLGHALDLLRQMPPESVSCAVTSPPYWGLRDYSAEPVIWGGNKDCRHEWIRNKTAGDIRFRGKNSIVGNNRNLNIYPIKHHPNEISPGKEGWYKDKGGLSKKPLRSSFCSLCGAWRGNLGLEPSFDLYIKHLCDIFDEVKRVLRKDGTCWVVIGDSYSGSGKAGSNSEYQDRHTEFGKPSIHPERFGMPTTSIGLPSKSLVMIPQRFAIEMVNRDWILRNEIVWLKNNNMPASVKDRFTVNWEHVFFFVKSNKTLFWTNEGTLECVSKHPLGVKGVEGVDWKWKEIKASYPTQETKLRKEDAGSFSSPRARKYREKGRKKVSLWSGHDYWFEQQFEKYAENSDMEYRKTLRLGKFYRAGSKNPYKENTPLAGDRVATPLTQGRNKRAVWAINTKPFPEAHFAVYPEKLIEPIIQAGCPEYVCRKCGKARVKILDRSNRVNAQWGERKSNPQKFRDKREMSQKVIKNVNMKEIGYSDCGCGVGWESGVVLDPFSGAGTTALVALKQNKRFIGIDVKQEYLDMSYKRISKVQPKLF